MSFPECAPSASTFACGDFSALCPDGESRFEPCFGARQQLRCQRTGAMFIRASQEWLEQFEDVRFEGLKGANAQKTLLVVAVMAAHALGEGSGVGVSFCGHRGWVQVHSPQSLILEAEKL